MSRVRRVRGRSCFASRGGIRLHYLEYGEGDRTMVILPGITSPAATWEFVAEPLADGLRVVTWDARGRGLSDHPSSGYAMADYAGDLDMLLERLDLDRPVILGHSMGARVATYFAARHPERVGPLIIVDPPLMGPGRPYATPLDAYIDELRSAQAGELSVEDLRESWPTWDDDRLLDREEWLPTCSELAASGRAARVDPRRRQPRRQRRGRGRAPCGQPGGRVHRDRRRRTHGALRQPRRLPLLRSGSAGELIRRKD
jgi:N-formylmaleamate deformylase